MELFNLHTDIPKKDFVHFKVCNSASRDWKYRQEFYFFKQKFLLDRGHEDGFDVQQIEDTLRSVNVALKRYILNGELFHVPVGEADRRSGKIIGTGEQPAYKNVIIGLVQHEVIRKVEEVYCFFYLLKRYEKKIYKQYLSEFLNGKSKKAQTRYKEIRSGSKGDMPALAEFLKIEKQTLKELCRK